MAVQASVWQNALSSIDFLLIVHSSNSNRSCSSRKKAKPRLFRPQYENCKWHIYSRCIWRVRLERSVVRGLGVKLLQSGSQPSESRSFARDMCVAKWIVHVAACSLAPRRCNILAASAAATAAACAAFWFISCANDWKWIKRVPLIANCNENECECEGERVCEVCTISSISKSAKQATIDSRPSCLHNWQMTRAHASFLSFFLSISLYLCLVSVIWKGVKAANVTNL